MKKGKIIILIIFIVSIIFLLSFFMMKDPSNTKNAKIVISKSNIYTKREINDAINIVLVKFKQFPATLDKIWYDEEKSNKECEEWAKQYNADEAIVLFSNFKTYKGEKSINNGFNSDFEYINWNWILVRNNKGKWYLKDWGY